MPSGWATVAAAGNVRTMFSDSLTQQHIGQVSPALHCDMHTTIKLLHMSAIWICGWVSGGKRVALRERYDEMN